MARVCNCCGNVISEGDKFCGNCGAEIAKTNSLANVCNCCGSVISEGDRFCENCGAEIAKANLLGNVCTCCGNAISEGDKFCENCGAEIAKANSLGNVCACCGNAISKGDKFCKNCGTEITKSNSLKQNEKKSEKVFINNKCQQEVVNSYLKVNDQSNINKVSLIDRIKLFIVKNEDDNIESANYSKRKYLLIFLTQVSMIVLYIISSLCMLKFEKVVLSPVLYLGLLWFGISVLNILILMLIVRNSAKVITEMENNHCELVSEVTEQIGQEKQKEQMELLNYDKASETEKLTNTNSEVKNE